MSWTPQEEQEFLARRRRRNIMIGLVTPPVGLCLYVMAGIARISIAEITREIWPYVLALIAVLMLITFVPGISLWLPHALGYGVAR